MLDPIQARKQILKSCRRVVLKVGTRLLADQSAIARLVTQIHALRESGRQVILVSSGAVGMGAAEALMTDPAYAELKEALGLDRDSQVLMISTEGDTDPENYRKIVWGGEYPTV